MSNRTRLLLLMTLVAATGSDLAAHVTVQPKEVAVKSLRNLDNVHVLPQDQLNTYDVMKSDDVVFTRAALDAFVAGPPTGRSATAVAAESEGSTL